jgi:hypothetical protein
MIHAAMVSAMRRICELGISKGSENKQQGYRFRGIDAAMNEMSPILVNNGITVTPRYSELSVTERLRGPATDGKFSRCVTLKGSFTFAAADGSSVTAEAYGESIDTGDKAVIKAQTVAFRTVLFQQFVVPLMSMDSELDDEDDGGERPPAPPPPKPSADEKPPYTDEMVNGWAEKIMTGKTTAANAIAKIKTRYTLTAAQVKAINAMEVKP